MISYDEFKKVEIRAGKILSAEKIADTDKLVKLMVDFGETKEVIGETCETVGEVKGEPTKIPMRVSAPRQIVSGIALRFPDPSVLIGKTCMFVTNLEPRVICGHESNGMLFAVSTADGGFSLLEPNETIKPGTLAI